MFRKIIGRCAKEKNAGALTPKIEKRLNAGKLAPVEKMLVTLRDELYNGSWEKFYGDLGERLKGRPCIYKLAEGIKQDMQKIDYLQKFEIKYKRNLVDYVKDEK